MDKHCRPLGSELHYTYHPVQHFSANMWWRFCCTIYGSNRGNLFLLVPWDLWGSLKPSKEVLTWNEAGSFCYEVIFITIYILHIHINLLILQNVSIVYKVCYSFNPTNYSFTLKDICSVIAFCAYWYWEITYFMWQ